MSAPATTEDPVETLQAQFPGACFAAEPFVRRPGCDTPTSSDVTTMIGQPAPRTAETGVPSTYLRVPADRLLEVMRFLRDDPRMRFNMLFELNGIDYLNFPKAKDRYAVTYGLLSIVNNRRLWIKCFVNDPEPTVPSVCAVWKGAEWMEREVYDMFGIRFDGHPDLRRILTWEGFESHPLRKDYPLRGRGERENYEVVTRDSA